MPRKIPSRSSTARRYNAGGRTVEQVEIHVNQVGGTVYLVIEGEKVTKNYTMTTEDWLLLSQAVIRIPTRQSVCNNPAFWITGPGWHVARETLCPHDCYLTEPCSKCDHETDV